MRPALWLLPLALLGACGDKDDDTAPDEGTSAGGGVGGDGGGDGGDALRWYSSCGDPSCAGYRGPTEGLPICTDETEGASCDESDVECDLEDACNTRMLCTTEDPKASEYGCPQSRAAVKSDIVYLSPGQREQARQQLLGMRLATWRYTWEAPGHKPHLGFLIDDQPGSAAVQADGAHVDLYGYTSLTVAAVQAQQAELATLRTELAETRGELETMRGEVAAMRQALAALAPVP